MYFRKVLLVHVSGSQSPLKDNFNIVINKNLYMKNGTRRGTAFRLYPFP